MERQAGADLHILLRQFLTPEEIVGLKRDAYLSPGLRPPAVKWVDQLTPFPGPRAKAEQQRWETIKDQNHKFDKLCASHEPFVGFMALFFLAIAKLRVCRRYIRRHCYYDIRRGRYLRRPDVPPPQNHIVIAGMFNEYALYERVLWAGLHQLWLTDARTEPAARVEKALKAMRKIYDLRPDIMAVGMSYPDESVKWSSISSVSGKLLRMIELKRESALLRALDGSEGSPRHKLIEELPAQTLMAWNELPSGSDMKTLRKKVIQRLKYNGPEPQLKNRLSPASYRKAIQEFHNRNSTESSLKRWREQQEATRALNLIMASADLSPREHQVIMMIHEDLSPTEIGSRLGMSAGSVRVLKSRAMSKLQKAANA